MTNPTALLARHTRRPLLLLPEAAEALVQRLAAADPRGMKSESRFLASLRKLNIFRPSAMEDDEVGTPEPQKPACYSPLWAQQTYGEPEDEGFCWSLYRGAALFEVNTALSANGDYWCGTWYHGYDTLLAGFRDAANDARVKGMFVRMYCPGGVVAGGLQELAAYIRSIRAEAGGKPIHFYCDMACSAAYWIAAQGDRVVAPKVGLIGSIGAVIIHADYSGAYEEAGIKVEAIQFGEEKTAGASWKPLSESARTDLQAEIDECGHDFVADVAAGRPQLTADKLIATQARVFMGDHGDETRSGLALGFVDAIETEEQAFNALLAAFEPAELSTARQISLEAPAGITPQAQTETDMFKASQLHPKTKAKAAKPSKKADSSSEDTPDDDGDETGEDGDPVDEGADDENDAGEIEQPEAAAAAIARSPEARSHPQLALAAISSGQSLAQFKANAASVPAEAASSQSKSSPLREAMAGMKRIGADADKKAETAGGGLRAAAKAYGRKS